MRRGQAGFSILTLSCVLVAGCTNNANTPDTGANTNAGASTNASPSAPLKIVVIPKGLSHSFWQSVKRGADEAGRKENAQIVWNGPASEGEVSRQVQIVEDAITQKVDGIVLAPIDRKALVGVIERAESAKIPVVIFDSDANTDKRLTFVATDNRKGGELAAKRLGELVGGKGTVGMVPVQPNSQSTGDREDGFEAAMKRDFPAIKVVRSQYGYSDRAKSLAATEDMLTSQPNISGIFGPNESSVVGALGAIRNRNKSNIKLVGFDSANILVDALKSGGINALVLQNPYKMGFEGVMSIARSKRGETIPPRIDTGVVLVDKANMNTPENQDLLGVK